LFLSCPCRVLPFTCSLRRSPAFCCPFTSPASSLLVLYQNSGKDLQKFCGALNEKSTDDNEYMSRKVQKSVPERRLSVCRCCFHLESFMRSRGVQVFCQDKHILMLSCCCVADFVLYHDSWEEGEYKYGGVNPVTGEPCSNTKIWLELHHLLEWGVSKIWVLGGGKVTLQEMRLAAEEAQIPIDAFLFAPKRMTQRARGDIASLRSLCHPKSPSRLPNATLHFDFGSSSWLRTMLSTCLPGASASAGSEGKRGLTRGVKMVIAAVVGASAGFFVWWIHQSGSAWVVSRLKWLGLDLG